jgi:hypothetical protein
MSELAKCDYPKCGRAIERCGVCDKAPVSASGHRATAEKCAELVENEDCDQTEYTCGTITRCAKAIRAFAATLPEAPQPATPRSEPTDTDPQGSKRLFLGPTPEMIEAGAQRLVRVETGEEKWPDAWSKMDVRAARNDAERCWLSMWLAAPSFVSETPAQVGWKQVADVLERQVAWIDRDARHVAVVVKGREYILTLPPLPNGNEESK